MNESYTMIDNYENGVYIKEVWLYNSSIRKNRVTEQTHLGFDRESERYLYDKRVL